jgi:hypothetical protein
MAVNTLSSARQLVRVVLCACTMVFSLGIFGANAAPTNGEGVRFEGQLAYRFSRIGRDSWDVSASISRVVNYEYSNRGGLKAVLILSRNGYRPGSTLRGRAVAQLPLGLLEARTAYSGFSFSGRSRIPKGRYRVVLAIADGNNYLEHALNFPRKVTFGTQSRAFSRSSLALSREHVEDLALAQ